MAAKSVLVLVCVLFPLGAQEIRRTPDGKPDLSGFWQVLNTASWDLQEHSGQRGVPPGQGVVEGGEIPYQPWAAEKKKENLANRTTKDLTDFNCFIPGIPRATYMPYPFQIAQNADGITMSYEFAHASRTIVMDGNPHPEGQADNWMGDSRGHWEGDTLVIDVANTGDQTWFDRAGNFHSDALHVIERYTMASPDHILYEAAIEDSKVFTRTWKISMPLYRRLEKDSRPPERDCTIGVENQRLKSSP